MNSFEHRYWASYMDFLNNFKSLTYLGIPISLVIPYYYLIMDQAIKKLHNPSIMKDIKTQLTQEKDLQPLFEKHLHLYKKTTLKHQGKVVVYDSVTRIPYQMLKENFTPSDTLILMQKKINKKNTPGFQTVTFINLQNVTDQTIVAFQKNARQHLAKFKSHPIFGDSIFQDKFITLIPGIMKQIAAAKKFFSTTEVSCMILGTTNSSDTRILALEASSKGIPTICLQHGIPMLEFGYLPKVATYLAVYGKSDVEWYAKRGIPLSALKILGHPRMDEITRRKPMQKKLFYNRLKLDPNKKSVLLILHHEETEIPQAVIQHLKGQGKVNIVIKRRNGKQTTSAKTLFLQKQHPDLILGDDLHLYDLLHNTDAVVSYESTTVLEAILANKPVFMWKLNSLLPSTTDYYSLLNNYVFTDHIKLVESLMNTLEEKKVNKKWTKLKNAFVAHKYPDLSGVSTKLLSAFIQSIIK